MNRRKVRRPGSLLGWSENSRFRSGLAMASCGIRAFGVSALIKRRAELRSKHRCDEMADNKIRTDGHTIEITHPEKILFPENRITKGDLVDYYREIAPIAISHLAERPLIMEQYPDGIARKGFFHR